MTFIKGFKNVVSFLTIIPVGKGEESLDEVARYMWLFPIVGLLIGFIAAFFGNIFKDIFPLSISIALALFILLLLTGFHHLDGLIDFGDALVFQGTMGKRRRIMRDTNTGVGGFALGFFVLLITYLSLKEYSNLFIALMVSETLAKFSMVVGAYIGRPFHEGIGSAFTKAMKGNHIAYLLSFTISIAITSLLVGEKILILIFFTAFFSVIIIQSSNRLLGGISGDILGAINELTRMFIMLILVIL